MTTQERYIGRHPDDDRMWDCQCARCGSSLEFEQCEVCGGEGVDGHDCGEDSCCCADPDDNVPCQACGGDGVWPLCASSHEWCKSNPLPGRAHIASGTPEWFVIPAPRPAAKADGE